MVHLYGRAWTRAELTRYVADMAQLGGVRPVAFQDGPEAGVRALEFRTGAGLAFTVLSDRCMDVGLAEIDGVPLSFLTGVGYAHPAYYSSRGEEWLQTFPGGLFVTGGLDTYGSPSTDAGVEFGQHGRASSLPARGLSWDTDWDGDDYVLRARGKMRQVSFHGEMLQLTREITAKLGENRFAIHDVVENLAGRPEPHQILYHFNVGFPLLDEGSELEVKATRIEGIDEHARSVEATAHQIHGPVYGFQEQVLVRDVETDAAGWVSARVVNRAFDGGRGLALTIRYRKDELPYLWQWRNLRERAYVMGVEPGNADMRGRAYNREHGTLPILEMGETREYHLEVEATLGLS
jgi:uncharacterized protein DUF4432